MRSCAMSPAMCPGVATIRALILNSGLGRRMGELTATRPKCLVEVAPDVTVFDLQLRALIAEGVTDIVVTTGPFPGVLESYATERYGDRASFTFVNNPEFDTTNYIYSIARAKDALRGSDLVLMHGDLVFVRGVLRGLLGVSGNAVVVDASLPLPDKDFKAVVIGGQVRRIGVEFFDDALACQPLYRFDAPSWEAWLDAIVDHCERGIRDVYAEVALNTITENLGLAPFDVDGALCTEVDTLDDLTAVRTHADELLAE